MLKGLEADARVHALRVVERFDVVSDCALDLVARARPEPIQALDFQGPEKALHRRVVVAVAATDPTAGAHGNGTGSKSVSRRD